MRSRHDFFIPRRLNSASLRAALTEALPAEYRPQLDIWMARLLLLERLDPGGWVEDGVLQALGLPHLKDHKLTGPKATRLVTAKLAELEIQPIREEGRLYRNLDRLTGELGLTLVDRTLLAFTVLLRRQRLLAELGELVEVDSPGAAAALLDRVLGFEEGATRHALRPDGVLSAGGFLRLDPDHSGTFPDALDLLEGLAETLLGDHADLPAMLRRYFRPAPPARLSLDDFSYLRDDLEPLRRMLDGAGRQGTSGVNVLLYGAPGTGKTELVRALAAACRTTLFEISSEADEPDPTRRSSRPSRIRPRFRAYQLSQRLLAHRGGALILFDEVEDVFPHVGPGFLGMEGSGDGNKAWTNQLLETNPVPAVWVSNHIEQIDPAFRRRFDYAVEVPMPPQSTRLGMLQTALADVPVSPGWLKRVAGCERLTPAHIQQVAKVAHLMDAATCESPERMIAGVLQHNLRALGDIAVLPAGAPEEAVPYSLTYLNVGADLQALVAGLARRQQGRLCFYGPPGTGKTALARYLAEQMDRPLIKKRASDLLSMWVGETEKNLAAMFRQARREQAMLLLDEADSFLQDRRTASHSWELTQVNELLVQMEDFDGLFICATNLMDSLDAAVLRRFDAKIYFDYLKPDQVWAMFGQVMHDLHGGLWDPERADAWQPRIQRLTTVTPGDFASIRRQTRFMDQTCQAERFLEALEKEVRAKSGGKKPVKGFVE